MEQHTMLLVLLSKNNKIISLVN